jgi:linoleoyl-CoA desaturase
MGIGMAGVGMNVMHDGNHGSYSNKTGLINSWAVPFTSLPEMYTTGRYNMCIAPHLHKYPGHDEDLDAGRIIRFTKDAKWHSFHRFQYYSVFLYGLLTFNWAITTDFRQMKPT